MLNDGGVYCQSYTAWPPQNQNFMCWHLTARWSGLLLENHIIFCVLPDVLADICKNFPKYKWDNNRGTGDLSKNFSRSFLYIFNSVIFNMI